MYALSAGMGGVPQSTEKTPLINTPTMNHTDLHHAHKKWSKDCVIDEQTHCEEAKTKLKHIYLIYQTFTWISKKAEKHPNSLHKKIFTNTHNKEGACVCNYRMRHNWWNK